MRVLTAIATRKKSYWPFCFDHLVLRKSSGLTKSDFVTKKRVGLIILLRSPWHGFEQWPNDSERQSSEKSVREDTE